MYCDGITHLLNNGHGITPGVSNFQLPQLVELVEFSSIPPSVIQSHSDPFTQNLAVRRFAMSLGIQYTAYSSLGTQYLRQTGGLNPVLQNPAIHSISTSLGISTAQVCMVRGLAGNLVTLTWIAEHLCVTGRTEVHVGDRTSHPSTKPESSAHQ